MPTLQIYIIEAHLTEAEASFWYVYLVVFNRYICFWDFSFLFKMLFSALYLISAIFAEIPQHRKFLILA